VRLEADGGGGEASAGAGDFGDKFLSTCWASPISISDDIWLVFQRINEPREGRVEEFCLKRQILGEEERLADSRWSFPVLFRYLFRSFCAWKRTGHISRQPFRVSHWSGNCRYLTLLA
jgi:hypothetical protein